MSLFQLGQFKLHSGEASPYKIDCDALTDDDIEALAYLASTRVPQFCRVVSIPRGGDRLANAMMKYVRATTDIVLIVDDVFTTGKSMQEARVGMGFPTLGVVIFARKKPPTWVVPLFQLYCD